ncbi:hypothetical protein DRE_04434 [Drechslerella stenobrocha 248]|uniref:Uncharacterized protein n=1 Tax=Drechslerella stenobrocha 248 TaxID=1043628 RepID=W7I1X8_9PEZI|nr:hypothetical protein DRE_04434 [Drechslerella stenobrocha 248]
MSSAGQVSMGLSLKEPADATGWFSAGVVKIAIRRVAQLGWCREQVGLRYDVSLALDDDAARGWALQICRQCRPTRNRRDGLPNTETTSPTTIGEKTTTGYCNPAFPDDE